MSQSLGRWFGSTFESRHAIGTADRHFFHFLPVIISIGDCEQLTGSIVHHGQKYSTTFGNLAIGFALSRRKYVKTG